MDIRTLEYFLAVTREGSMTGAAEALHLTQPTLSRQMKDLEAELGKKLFFRGRRITLTEDGILLRGRAEEMLDLFQKTENEIANGAAALSGDVSIGTAGTFGMQPVLQVASDMQKAFPGVRFHIAGADRRTLLERLNTGLDDFTLFVGKADLSRYGQLPLPGKNRWGVLMRPEDPLVRRAKISPAELWDRPLILSRQADDCAELFQWLGKTKEDLRLSASCDLACSAAQMAAAGMGLALTPEAPSGPGDGSLLFRPLSPALPLEASVIWKKYKVFSAPSAKFLASLRNGRK
jgi:DNA-binding transcriptional LysR family regulator